MNTKEKTIITGMAVFGLLFVVYVGVGFYFLSHFFPGTTLDGRNIGGLTVEKMKQEMTDEIHSYVLTIQQREGKSEQISGSSIALEPKWDGTAELLMLNQSAFAWPLELLMKHDLTGEILVEYDENKLAEQLAALECMDPKNQTAPKNASFSKFDQEKGFTVKPSIPGTKIDEEKMASVVTSAVAEMASELSLEEAGVYVSAKILEDDERLAKAVKKLNKYAKSVITFQIGDDTLLLDASEFGEWFTLDKKLKLVLRQDKVEEYVSSLANTYNTCYSSKKLQTSYGTEVTIENSHYGWKIDEEAEKEQIIREIKAGKPVTRDLNYQMTANSHGKRDYGDSYVEINLTAQHLFLYKDGKLVLDTDFVSGNVAGNNASPTGAYGIFWMKRNAVLRGDNYATPVSYWMPFAGNVGMHDANWRSRFGGTIYKYNGSHGCINLPVSAAKTIFETVENNYPVLVYELPGTEGQTGTDVRKAEAVASLIDSIGKVTVKSGTLISKAESAYDKLTPTEKLSVKNHKKLVKAKKKYEQLLAKQQKEET